MEKNLKTEGKIDKVGNIKNSENKVYVGFMILTISVIMLSSGVIVFAENGAENSTYINIDNKAFSDDFKTKNGGYQFKIHRAMYSEDKVSGIVIDVIMPDGTVTQVTVSEDKNAIVGDVEINVLDIVTEGEFIMADITVYDLTTTDREGIDTDASDVMLSGETDTTPSGETDTTPSGETDTTPSGETDTTTSDETDTGETPTDTIDNGSPIPKIILSIIIISLLLDLFFLSKLDNGSPEFFKNIVIIIILISIILLILFVYVFVFFIPIPWFFWLLLWLLLGLFLGLLLWPFGWLKGIFRRFAFWAVFWLAFWLAFWGIFWLPILPSGGAGGPGIAPQPQPTPIPGPSWCPTSYTGVGTGMAGGMDCSKISFTIYRQGGQCLIDINGQAGAVPVTKIGGVYAPPDVRADIAYTGTIWITNTNHNGMFQRKGEVVKQFNQPFFVDVWYKDPQTNQQIGNCHIV